MSKISFSIFLSIITVLFFSIWACKKENDNPVGAGSLHVEFDNVANGSTLVLGQDYTNANGDVMNFSQFDYYVSNFSLVKADGTVYTVPKDSCYFLIRENGGENTEIELNNIPAGDYKEIRFMLGIDSLKSVSPLSERTGALDPAGEGADMYRSFEKGYIFVKVEGKSPQAPIDPVSDTNKFKYHIGSYGSSTLDYSSNLKWFTISDNDGDVAEIRINKHPVFHLKVDVMEIFKSPVTVNVAVNPIVMETPYSKIIADNYSDMITLDHIHN